MRFHDDRRGMTLVEILIVVGIMGLLLIILGASYQGWMEKYKVEDATKRLYADIMEARARTLQARRFAFVRIDVAGYRRYWTYEDSNPAPDGNGTLETGTPSDRLLKSGTTAYTIVPALSGGATTLAFNREGIAQATGTIRLTSGVSPDYDCMTIGATRIRMGKWDAGAGVCLER